MELKSRSMRIVESCRFKNIKENQEDTPNKIYETITKPVDSTPFDTSNVIFIEPDDDLMQIIDTNSSSLPNISLLENEILNTTELENQDSLGNVSIISVLSSDYVPTENSDNIYTELKAAAVLDPDVPPNITDDIQKNDQAKLELPLKALDPDIGIPVLSVLQSNNIHNGAVDDNDSYQDKEKQNNVSGIQDFLEDPDFIPENGHSDSERETANENTQGRPKQGRKRKFPNQNRQIRKKKANTNQEHFNAKGNKVAIKEFLHFNCDCRRKCTEKISIEIRRAEFEKFWQAGSYETRCALIQGSVKEIKKKRSYSANSKRQFSRQYYFSNVEVCKNTYLKTLGISQTRIDFALSKLKANEPINDKRGKNSGGRNAISEETLNEVTCFINSMPRYISHYTRNPTTAKFLSPNLNLQILYDLYNQKYPEGVRLSKFKKIFYSSFNLRFKKPQKDTCLRCDNFKVKMQAKSGNDLDLLKSQHNNHLNHAYALRNQMKDDLKLAQTDPAIETLTFDLEKTLNLPRLPTSIVYYKRQLNLFNQGIHCGSSGKGFFYIWLEYEAGRGTQEVGSSLRKFILEHLKATATKLILWADSCGGQNRSIKMVLMLQHILQNHSTLETITLRFLQPGHTFLPNDSEFGDVECALKTHNRLYTEDDYIHVMRNCRRKNQFIVTRLGKTDFISVSPLQKLITNRKVDIEKNKISWLNTCEIGLQKDNPFKLYMKCRVTDEPHIVDISKGRKNKTTLFDAELPLLWPNGRELSAAKIKDLKEMLKLIPNDSKSFYDFLKTITPGDFADDTEGFGADIDFDVEENNDLEGDME